MSTLDGVLTLMLMSQGASEVNPVMALFVPHNLGWFAAIKLTLTSVGAAILVVCARMKLFRFIPGELLLYLVVGCYIALMAYELHLLANPPPSVIVIWSRPVPAGGCPITADIPTEGEVGPRRQCAADHGRHEMLGVEQAGRDHDARRASTTSPAPGAAPNDPHSAYTPARSQQCACDAGRNQTNCDSAI